MPFLPTRSRSAGVRVPTGDGIHISFLVPTEHKTVHRAVGPGTVPSVPLFLFYPFSIWGRSVWLVLPQGCVLDHWTIEASVFTAAAETSSLLTLNCHIHLAVTLHLEYRNWFAFSFFCLDLQSKSGALHELYQLFGLPGSQGPLLWLVFFGEKVRQKETKLWRAVVWLGGLRGKTHSVGGQSSGLGLLGGTGTVLITLGSVHYIKYVLYVSCNSENTIV